MTPFAASRLRAATVARWRRQRRLKQHSALAWRRSASRRNATPSLPRLIVVRSARRDSSSNNRELLSRYLPWRDFGRTNTGLARRTGLAQIHRRLRRARFAGSVVALVLATRWINREWR